MKKMLPGGSEYLGQLKGAFEVKKLRLSLNFDESVLPPELEDWLAKLSLLYGVPFEHLVPNAEMLPVESLRFFYVDPNWTSALVDGALSVGAQSSRDVALVETIYNGLQESLQASVKLVRRRLAQAEMPEEVYGTAAVSGLLMRSQLVSGWPGLEVAAYEDYTVEANNKLNPIGKIENLRIERLAPDVMLCLFAKMPKLVQFNEPKEGLSFGARSNGKIVPRFLGYHDGQPAGEFVTGSPTPADQVDIVTRDNGKRVIDIAATKAALITVLDKYNALKNPGELSPADYAIQLIKSAEQQSFLSGDIPQPNPHDCIDY